MLPCVCMQDGCVLYTGGVQSFLLTLHGQVCGGTIELWSTSTHLGLLSVQASLLQGHLHCSWSRAEKDLAPQSLHIPSLSLLNTLLGV